MKKKKTKQNQINCLTWIHSELFDMSALLDEATWVHGSKGLEISLKNSFYELSTFNRVLDKFQFDRCSQ